MPGLLITFEGGEGSGKSSRIKSLGRWLLEKYGIVPRVAREPGGTELGELLRDIVLTNKDIKVTTLAEVFIFQAARAQIVSEVVKPNLLQNRIVLLDRYGDSSKVYQGAVRGVGVNVIQNLNDLSTGNLIPDLTFLLDLDPEIGLQRKKDKEKLDKIDSENRE